MMNVSVVRHSSDSKITFSKIFIDGKFQCYGLEDSFREVKVAGKTRIPCGTYRVGVRHSPRFTPSYGHDLLWIMDVPNFQYVLIHKGNKEQDTDGCLLVGNKIDAAKGVILESKIAYDLLYPKLKGEAMKGQCFITFIDFDRA